MAASMNRPPCPGLNTFVLFAALALAGGVSAAESKKTKQAAKPAASAGDSAPVLVSTKGGGATWSNVKELTAAAEKGNPKAEAQLGEMLLRGDPAHNVAEDRAKALELLERAARKGEGSAAFRIGMLLDDGDGVPQDRARALAYFRAAAAGGVIEAMHNIGAAYASARGVKRDFTEGLAWLLLAKQRGSASSAESAVRAQIEKMKRPEWIRAAEKRVAEIERELAEKKAPDFLPPPAPLARK